MDIKPKSFSILINNYNYASFLGDCIDSALQQSTSPNEIIVVDDGSTDGSRDVIDRYDARIRSIFKDNGGQTSAFNTGFAASTGDIVLFLDADDVLLPTAVETIVPVFADQDVSKVHWPMQVIDQNGIPSGTLNPAQELPRGNLRKETIRKGPESYLSSPTSGNAWSREFLSQVMPLRDIADAHYADAFLINLAPLYGVIERIDIPQSCYRAHEASHTGKMLGGEILRYRNLFADLSATLAEHLERQGVVADAESWSREPSWLRRSAETLRDLEQLIAVGETFALINDCELGYGEILEGRTAVPFPNRDGQYWGAPESDADAIAELRQMTASGVTLVAIGWPAFWWLEHYKGWSEYLRANSECLLENDYLLVFRSRSLRSSR